MSDKIRCACRRCAIRGLMGPAIITTLGILFLLSEFHGAGLWFGRTFPVIFIVIGGILLASSLAPMDGHIDPSAPQQPPSTPPSSYPGPTPGQGQ
jgi:hypothetical protein